MLKNLFGMKNASFISSTHLNFLFVLTIILICFLPLSSSSNNFVSMIGMPGETPSQYKNSEDIIDITGTAYDGNNTPLNGQTASLFENNIEIASVVIIDGVYLFEDISITAINNQQDVVRGLQNFPNPFGASTRITYSLDKNERVIVDLFDANGKRIKTIDKGEKQSGKHSITIDAEGLSEGIYFGAITIGDKTIVKKMIHVKGGLQPEGDGHESEAELKSVKSEYQLVITGEDFITKDTSIQLYGNGLIEVPPLTVLEKPLITGFVYDLDTKWDENGDRLNPVGIPGMVVYQGSNSEVQTTTDDNGRFYLRLSSIPTNPDSIFVVGASPADTTYYFWKKPAFEITHDTNYITAFNDTTGIPLFTRMWDQQAGIGVLEHIVYVADIADNYVGFGEWEYITTRFKDELMHHEVYGNGIRVFMNRDIAPNEYYADSSWAGLKAGEIGRFKFVEVDDISDAMVVMLYDHNMVGEATFTGDWDDMGPYLNYATIRLRGPPGGTPLGELGTVYVVAHEKYHIAYFGGEHSPFIQDNFYGYVYQRVNALLPIEGSEREMRSVEIYWNLERNPKFFHYFK